ncbi:hypothetical protein DXG01_016917 [Tephrocybe rancida]|nr:hypothetical protein DXG01_016917 [Tephrocybe rancida]
MDTLLIFSSLAPVDSPFTRKQVKRWMAYQYWKDHKEAAKDTGVQDAFLALLHHLTGQGFPKPCCVTPSNHWQALQENHTLVDTVLAARMTMEITGRQQAGLRSQVVSDLFKALPLDLRDEYIEATIPFMQQILDLVTKLTGMKTTFMFRGPEPADGGRLNIISVHSGHTPRDIKMNFGASECEAHQKLIVPVFSRFLKKCYTVEECRAWILSEPTPSLSTLMEEHVDYVSLVSLGDLSQLLLQASAPAQQPPQVPQLNIAAQGSTMPPGQRSPSPPPSTGSPQASPHVPSPVPSNEPHAPLVLNIMEIMTPTAQDAPTHTEDIRALLPSLKASTSSGLKWPGEFTDPPPSSKRLKPAAVLDSLSPQIPEPIPRIHPRPLKRTPAASATMLVPSPVLSPTPAPEPAPAPAPTPAPTSPLSAPPLPPAWFALGLELLSSGLKLEEHWFSLLRVWAAFKKEPVEEGMLAWWDVLPHDSVKSSGLNGVLTLLFGLLVWGERIPVEATAQRNRWVWVVDEVHVTLEGN